MQNDLIQKFADVYNRIQGLVDHAVASIDLSVLNAAGLRLFAGLALIALAWKGIEMMLAGGVVKDLLGKTIRQLFIVGLVFWLSSSGYEQVFVQGVDGSLSAIADMLLPGSASSGSSMATGAAFMLEALQKVGGMVTQLFADATIWDTLTIAFQNLPTLLVLFLTLIIMFFALLGYLAFWTVSMFLVKLVLLLGPVFVPWLVLERTAFIFWGWLRILIVAGLYKVVGGGILMFAGQLLAGETDLIAMMDGKFPDSLAVAVGIASLQLTILYLIAQIPKIAQGLVSGMLGGIQEQ